ncbi:MAG: hypothetical protein K0M45_09020 [Candidatus Paracaedibacteraceae bacterium]|nr:hypothetical protein [Candidatus Paracaedibacteraceae bacterium]
MKLFFHACLLSILALPSFAGELQDLNLSVKGKERTVIRSEEQSPSSEDEERGFSSKNAGSSSENSDESQGEEANESKSNGEEVPSIHTSLSTVWTGEHLPFCLREPAREFYKAWQPLSAQLGRNPYANFINQVVERDGIGMGNPPLTEEENIEYNFSSSSSSSGFSQAWEVFIDIAGKVFSAPSMLDNPFADYFKGVFAYFGFSEEQLNSSLKSRYKEAAELLNHASKHHYLRATNFMQEKKLDHVLRLDEEELGARKKLIINPPEVIIDYVTHMNYPRLAKLESIDTLEFLIDSLIGLKDYQNIYNHWLNELTRQLESSKKVSSKWTTNLSVWTLNSFAAGVLLTSAVNTFSSWESDQMVAPVVLGTAQAASGITTALVGGASTPWMTNLWSSLRFIDAEGKFHWWPARVSLLKDSLTSNEIKDSVRLVILYSLLYNIKYSAEELKNDIDLSSDRSKKYIRKLRDLILSCDYAPTETFSRVILKKEPEEFNY